MPAQEAGGARGEMGADEVSARGWLSSSALWALALLLLGLLGTAAIAHHEWKQQQRGSELLQQSLAAAAQGEGCLEVLHGSDEAEQEDREQEQRYQGVTDCQGRGKNAVERTGGRDPHGGVVIARYEAPEGHSPGGLRHVLRMGHDNRCFSADLLALAVAGHLRIEQEDGVLADAWTLKRLPGTGDLDAGQRAVLDLLFQDGDRLVLDNAQAATLQAARHAHAKALARRYEPAMFRRNGRSIAIAVAIALVGGVAAFAASGGSGLPLLADRFGPRPPADPRGDDEEALVLDAVADDRGGPDTPRPPGCAPCPVG